MKKQLSPAVTWGIIAVAVVGLVVALVMMWSSTPPKKDASEFTPEQLADPDPPRGRPEAD